MTDLMKIIKLAKQTNDRVIIVPENGEPFVVMPINEYERLVNPSEVSLEDIHSQDLPADENLAKINREVAGLEEETPSSEEEKFYIEPVE